MDNNNPKNKRFRSFIYIFLSLIVSGGIFTYLFSQVSYQDIWSAISSIPWNTLILFVVLSLSMSICRTWRYVLLLSITAGSFSSLALFLVTLARNCFSDLLPARAGTLIYIYILHQRLGVPLSPAASSYTICFIFDIIAVALLGIVTSLAFFSNGGTFIIVLLSGMVLFIVSGLLLILLPSILNLIRKGIGRVKFLSNRHQERCLDLLANIERDISQTKESGMYGKVFVLSVLVRFFKYFSLYVLFTGLIMGIGMEVASFPFFKVLAAMIAAELAASLPISGIAGFGAYEGTWTLVFSLLGYEQALAAMTSISHHLITQVYGYSLGAIAILLLLMPHFKYKSSHQLTSASTQSVAATRYFWTRLFIFLITSLTCWLLLFPGFSFVNEQEVSSPFYDKVGAQAVQKGYPKMNGRLIFQRPGGIFTLKIGGAKARLLVANGRYPRWSSDGSQIVFLRENNIMIMSSNGDSVERVAVARKPAAACFYPDGKHILYIEENSIKKVNIRNKRVTNLLQGHQFLELDISDDGKRIAATVKTITGYYVKLFELATDNVHTVSRGCSASLSPDGKLVTVNTGNHRKLKLYNTENLQVAGIVRAPETIRFDNHKWSNNSSWVISTAEGKTNDIYMHQTTTSQAFRLTTSGDSDRGDLYIW